jgi:hypothetical protein
MTTNGTNGHPFPLKPPVEMPPRPEPTRELVVAVWDGDTLLELAELSTEELLGECRRRGLLSDSPAGFVTQITRPLATVAAELAEAVNEGTGVPTAPSELGAWSELVTRAPELFKLFPLPQGHDEPRDTEPPPTNVENEVPELGQSGNPERDPRLVYREVGMLPSERIAEISEARLARQREALAGELVPIGHRWEHPLTPGDIVEFLNERLGRE